MMPPHSMITLNIIGAGRVGRTLAALWHRQAVFAIGGVLNRTAHSAGAAVAVIGAGCVANALRDMPPADLWMLTTPDGDIARNAQAMAAGVVFHCSGALPSKELRAVISAGVHVASVHPLKSFADPANAMRTFAGTYCAAEGDPAALAVLTPAFERIGAHVSEIDPTFKTVYHAASVMVCNYLTALMEAGLQCYEKAGLSRETASAMMEPLVRETMDNVFKLGTIKALTGPIARGDHAVVARQLEALHELDPRIAEIYRALGTMAVDLSRVQGGASEEALGMLESALRHTPKL
jgi:predicted short-subunit dehydrogenase-like oxidoreductase (DUF2520 family)